MSRARAPASAAPAVPAESAALPLVAIIGRPNVGKSTLFNRLVGRRQAIVRDEPGTTRDRQYGEAEWAGVRFRLVDTGGWRGEQLTGPYAEAVEAQVRAAMAEADAICLIVDAQRGVLPADEDIAAWLRDAAQPVYVVVNKADNERLEAAASDFFRLGCGAPHVISAYHGRGVGDLLDAIVEWLPRVPPAETAVACRLAIVGRPNVGKSSLVNALLGAERMVVSALPGTTRDAVDSEMVFEGQALVLVDTAGIRRRGRVLPGTERAAVTRAQAALARADVAAVVLDGGEDVAAQDQHVLGAALDAGCGVVLVVNKTDLLTGEADARGHRQQQLEWRARFAAWAPVVWTSAQAGTGLEELLGTALRVAEERRKRVATADLNALLQRAVREHPPAAIRGRPLKFYYATQAEVAPPTFVIFTNYPAAVHFSYRRYLEKRLRQAFGFEGVVLRLQFRGRSGDRG